MTMTKKLIGLVAGASIAVAGLAIPSSAVYAAQGQGGEAVRISFYAVGGPTEEDARQAALAEMKQHEQETGQTCQEDHTSYFAATRRNPIDHWSAWLWATCK
ncbi:MAG: hypothetical protein H0T78_11110 [Longispora sp.]|nr:hypothetical protein [Longispora sp. (in: high G+C Gram-positive bacteria)]